MKRLYLIFLLLPFQLITAQNPNDCNNAILLCGDTDLGIIPSGIGRDEFLQLGNPVPTCYDFRAAQVWFRVEIETTGSFSFELTPDVIQADYDFAVFGPVTDCNNLGPAIRCSSTNPTSAGVTGATGLNDTETDQFEGPGPNGNGFLAEIPANAGEVYYIIIGLAIGNGGFSMSTSGTADLPPSPTANPVADLSGCDDFGPIDGIRQFDFSALSPQILQNQNNASVTYHESLNDANIGINALRFPYENITNPQEIFVRVFRNDSNCTDFTQFSILVEDSIGLIAADPLFICSDNTTETFDFNGVVNTLIPNFANQTISYHLSLSDAQGGLNPQGSLVNATTTEVTYYIKIVDPTGNNCETYVSVPLSLVNPPMAGSPPDLVLCDDDFDGSLSVNLAQQDSNILNGLDPALYQVLYYDTELDRSSTQNRLPNTYSNRQNPQPIFARLVETRTGCFTDVAFNIIVDPKPQLLLQDDIIVCINAVNPTTIGVAAGFDFYEWDTGVSGSTTNTIDIDQPGSYTVTVTNSFGCQSSLTITALPSDIAILDDIITQNFRNGDNRAEFIVSGPGDYEFAVDDGPYQNSNFFDGLYKGFHTVRIRDKNGCGVLIEEFAVLDYQQFFTPNGDGYHDRWTFDGISEYPNAIIYIYDRKGKFLHQMAPEGPGWDGTFIGNPMPSSTYWFTLAIPGKPDIKGYFALKR